VTGSPQPDRQPDWVRWYPDGLGATIDVRHPSMLHLWRDAVDRQGEEVACLFFDAELSYARLDRDADALAAALVRGGLRPGERVGILLQNDPQWLVALLATWKAGAVAVSLSPMMRPSELRFQLDDAAVAVLICLDTLYRDVAAHALDSSTVRRTLVTDAGDWLDGTPRPELLGAGGVEVGVRGVEGVEAPERLLDVVAAAAGAQPPAVDLGPDDVAVLTYTSGTTGPPKGAMLTHGGISHNAQLAAQWFGLGAGDPILAMAPLFHVTGLVLHLGISWYAGGSVILGHRFDPRQILDSVERRRPVMVIAAITAFIALLEEGSLGRRDLSSLRVVLSGGAPVTVGVVDRFEALTGLRISPVYGLTETSSPSHLVPPGVAAPVDAETGVLSVGVPVPGCRVDVFDLVTGEPLGPGEAGELAISGPMVVPGYWGRPDESAAAIPGGRLLTGDVGLRDEAGWFFVVDRRKDLIIASGYKVWPREVEEVLHTHPAVSEAAVVGQPDPYRGETVVAYVVPVAGVDLGEAELVAYCRERLASYKYPRTVHIVETIPKTGSGKVLRRTLRALGTAP
jgi:long-chain acyl-CoA synthetase